MAQSLLVGGQYRWLIVFVYCELGYSPYIIVDIVACHMRRVVGIMISKKLIIQEKVAVRVDKYS
jgi:hypothetical protein